MELFFSFVYWCLAAISHQGGPCVQTQFFLYFLFTQIYTSTIFTVNLKRKKKEEKKRSYLTRISYLILKKKKSYLLQRSLTKKLQQQQFFFLSCVEQNIISWKAINKDRKRVNASINYVIRWKQSYLMMFFLTVRSFRNLRSKKGVTFVELHQV